MLTTNHEVIIKNEVIIKDGVIIKDDALEAQTEVGLIEAESGVVVEGDHGEDQVEASMEGGPTIV